jgi:hypothetical protein
MLSYFRDTGGAPLPWVPAPSGLESGGQRFRFRIAGID